MIKQTLGQCCRDIKCKARSTSWHINRRNFISEKALALMEGSLKDRGFIFERGFKQVISHFAEMLEKKDGSHWMNTKNLVKLLW